MAASFPIFSSLSISPAFPTVSLPLFVYVEIGASVQMPCWAVSFAGVGGRSVVTPFSNPSATIFGQGNNFHVGRIDASFNLAKMVNRHLWRYGTDQKFVYYAMSAFGFAVEGNQSVSIFIKTRIPQPTSRSSLDFGKQERYDSSGLGSVFAHVNHCRTSNAILNSAHFNTPSGQMRWRM